MSQSSLALEIPLESAVWAVGMIWGEEDQGSVRGTYPPTRLLMENGTDCLGRRGAAVKNLSHSAFLHSGENDAPSNFGIKHLDGVTLGFVRTFFGAAQGGDAWGLMRA